MAGMQNVRDASWTGDQTTQLADIDWADITARLADLLGGVRRETERLGRPEDLAEQPVGLENTAHAASLQAQALLALVAPLAAVEDAGVADHPLARLARAYAEAFEAVRYAIASLAQHPQGQGRLPAQLAESAERAAGALVQAIELVFGQRRFGSLSNIFAYVGAVEGQADDLLRRGIESLLGAGADPATGGWDRRRADELRTLLALEALTDRCEDVADALLLVRYVL